jgi:hypothetical protein
VVSGRPKQCSKNFLVSFCSQQIDQLIAYLVQRSNWQSSYFQTMPTCWPSCRDAGLCWRLPMSPLSSITICLVFTPSCTKAVPRSDQSVKCFLNYFLLHSIQFSSSTPRLGILPDSACALQQQQWG